MTTPQYIGILLAAGRGRRMGTTKQLLPWPPPENAHVSDVQRRRTVGADDESNPPSPQPSPEGRGSAQTVVAASFDLVAPHCAEVIVVLGHDAPAIVEALQPRDFHQVLSDPQAEMLHSIRLGLVEAQRLGDGRPVLLHPADVPGTAPETVQRIIDRAKGHAAKAIMPEFNGNGGHPAVIPADLIHGIVTWQGDGGLRQYWQQNSHLRVRLPIDDPAVTRDLDTPGDYRSD